jgi:serine protease inhibitor
MGDEEMIENSRRVFAHKYISKLLLIPDPQGVAGSALSAYLSLFPSLFGATRNSNTHKQIAELLQLNADDEQQMVMTFTNLTSDLTKKNANVQFTFGHAFFCKDNEINPDFTDFCRANFDCEVHPLGDVNTIHEWVARNTSNKIKEVLPKTPEGPAVVILADYFKGSWESPFTMHTSPAKFYLPQDRHVMCDMMKVRATFAYNRFRSCEVVMLKYDPHYAFVAYVILPHRNTSSVEQVVEDFLTNPKDFDAMKSLLRFQKLSVSMPKFIIEKKLSIKTMLCELGMQDAFSPDAAFGRMSIKDDKADIYINDIHTATYLSVDKDGTEAASATATEFVARGKDNTPHMYCDSQFLFLVRHEDTGTFINAARIDKPCEP